ncbi:MAG: class I SAM-dependent methyltransferase [Magnetococcales bacterium]|nr:class I SAM-dependent methyltransferase [Magnetococcales bacterium]NGZ25644.1 class I SAM-dependent methyltransferase [Magnetococcales bacterium]
MTDKMITFRETCNILFSQEESYGSQRQAAQDLFSLLAGIIGYDDNQPQQEQAKDCFLPSGKAISLQGAARCLWEFARTSRFLQGVEAAVRAAQQRFPGERIRLLEAGCGPFALLALPLAIKFQSSEVGFTLLDIHPHSLEAAKTIVTALGLQDYVNDYVQADATAWICPDPLRPHVMVSETMQNALKKEPQVAITRNLAPQLLPGGIFLPEKVRVDFCFLYWITNEGEVPFQRTQPVATLYELRLDNPHDPLQGQFTLPNPLPENIRPGLCTHIQVFGDCCLEENQCSLTLPLRVKGLELQAGGTIHHEYIMGEVPGFVLTPG